MEQHNQEIGTRRDLVLYRLETARNDLKSARALFSIENCASHSRYFSDDEAGAKRRMQASYSQRNLMQMLWAILAIVLPCVQFAAGILPLLIPGTAIKLKGIKNSIKR